MGRFTAAAADTAPPARDSADARAAYAECGQAASDYLGGDWHAGRLSLYYAEPTANQWEGGARFFACSAAETSGPARRSRGRSGTVKGGLSGDRPLAMRCFNQTGAVGANGYYAEESAVLAVDCGIPHTVEYAGAYVPPDGPYPTSSEAVGQAGFPGCAKVGADFVGQSVNGLANRADIAMYAWAPFKEQWVLGDRTMSCFLVVPANTLVRGSLKGVGGGPLRR